MVEGRVKKDDIRAEKRKGEEGVKRVMLESMFAWSAIENAAGCDGLVVSLAPRRDWATLAPVESDQARAIFRALLAALHPDVAPKAAAEDTAGLWSLAVMAYRSGDAAKLRELLARARSNAAAARLPTDIVALRQEHDRLAACRARADRQPRAGGRARWRHRI